MMTPIAAQPASYVRTIRRLTSIMCRISRSLNSGSVVPLGVVTLISARSAGERK